MSALHLRELQGPDAGTVEIVIALVGAASVAITFYHRLRSKVITLERQLKELQDHPLLALHKKWESTPRGIAAFYDDVLRSRETQEENKEE
jgi:hypothetical protein